MKLLLLSLLVAVAFARAQPSSSSYTTQSVTIPGNSYTLQFGVFWSCLDQPVSSTPGRVELVDSQNQVVGWAQGNVANSGASGQTNLGTVTVGATVMNIMAVDLNVADGDFYGTWNLTGVAPGNYTLRFWNYVTEPFLLSNTVWTQTFFVSGSAPPPVQFTLVTSAGAGGTVSPGGTFDAGTVVSVSASPDSAHEFAGWTGDAPGLGNPIGVTLDRNKAVQATFSPKIFALTTSATAGGSVTPGGSYPYGTGVTVQATPDATHRFAGWTGDASGMATTILLTVTGPLSVQAVFSGKVAQTIAFPSPGNLPVGAPPVSLGASASSGLPVTYAVLSGPAAVSGGQLQVTGPGTVTVQASQAGDPVYLPAASVTLTLNVSAAAFIKYQPVSRTLLQDKSNSGVAPFVLE